MKQNNFLKRILIKILVFFIILPAIMPILSLKTIAEDSPEDIEDDPPIIVSLGDSYSSGEGNEPFYGQEDDIYRYFNQDWLAHRSKKAWAGMLRLPSVSGTMSDHRNENWYFAATSGAETKHFQGEYVKINPANGEDKKLRDEFRKLGFSDNDIDSLLSEKDLSVDPQNTIFDSIKNGKVDYVTITMGGNDADFVGILKSACMHTNYLLPNTEYVLSFMFEKSWKKFWKEGDGIRANLIKMYQEIQKKAGKQAHIIVVGYPQLIYPSGYSLFIRPEGALIINRNVTLFNQEIKKAVEECRDNKDDEGNTVNISFVSVEDAFLNRGMGAGNKSYLNGVIFPERYQDLQNGISSFSGHPNEKGQRAYAKCVQDEIDRLEAKKERGKKLYKNDLSISVFDINDELYGNHVIEIKGKEFTDIWRIGWTYKNYEKTIPVNSEEKVQVNLPNGDYDIFVYDNNGTDFWYSQDIRVRTEGAKTDLEFRTLFGEEKEEKENESDNPENETEQWIKSDYHKISLEEAPEGLDEFLNDFAWVASYGEHGEESLDLHEYDCSDGRETWIFPSLVWITDLFERYPVNREMDGVYSVCSADDIDWILKNIYNFSPEAIDRVKQENNNIIYSDGKYRGWVLGAGEGYGVKNIDVNYNGKYYLVSYDCGSWYPGADDLVLDKPVSKHYALMEYKTIDGKGYWSIYKDTIHKEEIEALGINFGEESAELKTESEQPEKDEYHFISFQEAPGGLEQFLSGFVWAVSQNGFAEENADNHEYDVSDGRETWILPALQLMTNFFDGYPVHPGTDGNYQVFDEKEIDWILSNIFNFSPAALEKIKQPGFSEYLRYSNGKYSWLLQIGGGYGVDNIEVAYNGKNYYVIYDSCTFDYDTMEMTLDQPVSKHYALMEYKTIDGKGYWSIYKDTTDPNGISAPGIK